MQGTSEEIALIVAAGTLLMLLILAFLMTFFFLHQRRHHRQKRELLRMTEAYQRELLQSQIEIQEQTLQHIAQEIHDNVGQVLSLAKMNLNALTIGPPNANTERILVTKGLVGKAINDLRDLSKTLNADYILHTRLPEAIRFELDILERTAADLRTFLVIRGKEYRLSPQHQVIVFRIVQELINNCLKHAHATQLTVALSYTDELFTLSLADNGQGFDLAQVDANRSYERGSGLHHIKARAALIGAQAQFSTQPGGGTSVLLQVPIPNSLET
ncbi:hypothetical protein GCM10027275_20800 [Rhabdobacter roseus]|uniref:histidine kinase n=1 Tax=Rhabdobacter roseus TaxID=1655419 RepID=A0A840TRZ0_9BACT|nr:ATP-binding protein [Rhabdobacter roseus]MBB5284013.1 signal transduction histidine kinase [Rhabdobacter roseus]